MKILLILYIIINAITFLAFVIDKMKARANAWRIPEAQLLGLCFIGGALGGLTAMQIVRHKTRHLKFTIGVPLMCLLQLVILFLWNNFTK